LYVNLRLFQFISTFSRPAKIIMDSSKRQNFGKLSEVIDPPNLIQNQVDSFHDFLQRDIPATHRKQAGLEAVFKEVMTKNRDWSTSAIPLASPSSLRWIVLTKTAPMRRRFRSSSA
jgi:DNA-directed RNA polymerase beta subunit